MTPNPERQHRLTVAFFLSTVVGIIYIAPFVFVGICLVLAPSFYHYRKEPKASDLVEVPRVQKPDDLRIPFQVPSVYSGGWYPIVTLRELNTCE